MVGERLRELEAEIQRLSQRRQRNWAKGLPSDHITPALHDLFEEKRAIVAKVEQAVAKRTDPRGDAIPPGMTEKNVLSFGAFAWRGIIPGMWEGACALADRSLNGNH